MASKGHEESEREIQVNTLSKGGEQENGKW